MAFNRLAVALVIGLTASLPTAFAQTAADSEAIVKKLLPELGPSRSLRRGIVADGKASPEVQPQVSLMINFEYRSAEITPSGKANLDALGVAMKDKRLTAARFKIIGHTDARGTPEYNLELSKRRAEAVRDYLAQAHTIPAARLDVDGRGHVELADAARPFDAVNRRVQIFSVWPNGATN